MMFRLLKSHKIQHKDNWARVWKRKTAYKYIVWATQMPNSNTDNTSMKTVV